MLIFSQPPRETKSSETSDESRLKIIQKRYCNCIHFTFISLFLFLFAICSNIIMCNVFVAYDDVVYALQFVFFFFAYHFLQTFNSRILLCFAHSFSDYVTNSKAATFPISIMDAHICTI